MAKSPLLEDAPGSPPNGEPSETEEKRGGKMCRDSEIVVMAKIAELLDDLDEPARSRVVAYLTSRYTRI